MISLNQAYTFISMLDGLQPKAKALDLVGADDICVAHNCRAVEFSFCTITCFDRGRND